MYSSFIKRNKFNVTLMHAKFCWPDSSVGIATGYGLEGPRIESGWRRDFPHLSRPALAHPASCTIGTGSFPGVKSGPCVTLTPHLLLVPWAWKGRAIRSMRRTACTEPQCLYKCALYLFCTIFSRSCSHYIQDGASLHCSIKKLTYAVFVLVRTNTYRPNIRECSNLKSNIGVLIE
jgi:hypothetical protein